MVGLLIRRSKVEIRILYYGDKEEHMRKEENCNRGRPNKVGRSSGHTQKCWSWARAT